MDYSALIQNRKSFRSFAAQPVTYADLEEIDVFFHESCQRLDLSTLVELSVFPSEVRAGLDGIVGYHQIMIGAPAYLLLRSSPSPHARENLGYMMEDLVLKLLDLGYDSCWLNIDDEKVLLERLNLDLDKSVCALIAFGIGKKERKTLRLTIKSMSDIDAEVKRSYFAQKKNIHEMVYLNALGSSEPIDPYLDGYGEHLWRAFYASTLSPSYLNRQPYAFVVKDNICYLIRIHDQFTNDDNAAIGHGIVMLHFAATLKHLIPDSKWCFDVDGASLDLPDGCVAVARYQL